MELRPYPKKIDGFPDSVGFEFQTFYKYVNYQFQAVQVPVYTLCEVKTKSYSTLTKEQKNHLDYCVSIGGRAYVAREADNEVGYVLEVWTPCS